MILAHLMRRAAIIWTLGKSGDLGRPARSAILLHAAFLREPSAASSSFEHEAAEGQRVLVISNPEGLEGTVSDGIVCEQDK